ncbi:O-antigen ligase family protein [Shewanella sp. SG44-6]|uniref:O-antigen ligase family protein n=1 Tax=Shewanella sp. SG44-6 TaxID=2760959 RepID=UPI001601D3CB|nr:O-antigen ligase family protein [Shewanella sp. SG44-6]MBB1392060.1 O-antigen ligase family protein [Shewanella sp. SG44-6]
MQALLLIYSFLPGFSKLFGSQLFFVLNVPIIFILFRKVQFSSKEIILCCIVITYIVLQSFQSFLFNQNFNVSSYFESLYVWILPFLAFFLSKKYSYLLILKAIANVSFIHAVFGLLTYGFISYPTYIQDLIDTLQDGAAYFRMSSVAGSLIFSGIVSIGFNIVLYLNIKKELNGIKFYLMAFILAVATFFSLQRSSWLAILIGVTIFCIYDKRKFALSLMMIIPLLLILVVFVTNNTFYMNRFMSLFSSDFNPVDERFMIWASGYNYLSENPFGYGIGQLGQFAYKNNSDLNYFITDGDYVKWASEGGIFFILFFISTVIYCFVKTSRVFNKKLSKSSASHIAISLGFLVQMIGSNI